MFSIMQAGIALGQASSPVLGLLAVSLLWVLLLQSGLEKYNGGILLSLFMVWDALAWWAIGALGMHLLRWAW